VLTDDRLGFYNELHQGPLGYEFDESESVVYGNFEPQLYFVHDFDQLGFPYQFALAAAFDAGSPRPPTENHCTCRASFEFTRGSTL